MVSLPSSQFAGDARFEATSYDYDTRTLIGRWWENGELKLEGD